MSRYWSIYTLTLSSPCHVLTPKSRHSPGRILDYHHCHNQPLKSWHSPQLVLSNTNTEIYTLLLMSTPHLGFFFNSWFNQKHLKIPQIIRIHKFKTNFLLTLCTKNSLLTYIQRYMSILNINILENCKILHFLHLFFLKIIIIISYWEKDWQSENCGRATSVWDMCSKT